MVAVQQVDFVADFQRLGILQLGVAAHSQSSAAALVEKPVVAAAAVAAAVFVAVAVQHETAVVVVVAVVVVAAAAAAVQQDSSVEVEKCLDLKTVTVAEDSLVAGFETMRTAVAVVIVLVVGLLGKPQSEEHSHRSRIFHLS